MFTFVNLNQTNGRILLSAQHITFSLLFQFWKISENLCFKYGKTYNYVKYFGNFFTLGSLRIFFFNFQTFEITFWNTNGPNFGLKFQQQMPHFLGSPDTKVTPDAPTFTHTRVKDVLLLTIPSFIQTLCLSWTTLLNGKFICFFWQADRLYRGSFTVTWNVDVRKVHVKDYCTLIMPMRINRIWKSW